MSNTILAAATAALLFIALGLNGCAPGTVIWVIPPSHSPATKGGGAPLAGGTVGSSSSSSASALTQQDRQQLTELLEKLK